MSSSIPIPSRHSSSSSSRSPSALPLPIPDAHGLGQSLPARTNSLFRHPASHAAASPLAIPFSAQDDLAITPSVELISPAARQWQSLRPAAVRPAGPSQAQFPGHARPALDIDHIRAQFDSWDFSELVTAADQVRTGMESGVTVAKRPPRSGVSGTYFFCTQEDEEKKLGVFKPMDEEAESIDMSPPPPFPPFYESPALDFTLGPAAHPGIMSPPAMSPPSSASAFHRAASISSDSENDARVNWSNHSTRSNGFHQGEGAYREVAAYLLDHDRFACVPQTALLQWLKPYEPADFASSPDCVSPGGYTDAFSNGCASGGDDEADHSFDSDSFNDNYVPSTERPEVNLQTKKGAFQVYVPNMGDADDFGPGVFDKDQVHRIAVLDIRTLNHDRHGGNILVAKSDSPNRRYDLIPIDHGYILPDAIASVTWPIWMDWPMIREPISEDVKRYIHYLDADTEARRLNEELDGVFRSSALRGLKIATTLLQKGVAAGLTLYDIGLLMYNRREDPGDRSELVKIWKEAEDSKNARERHIAQQKLLFSSGTPDDPHHRRHHSINAIETHDSFVDDYIVKYATRRIHELVTRVAAEKEKARETSSKSRGFLSRARSIPDFIIGEKPVHAILNCRSSNEHGQDVPAPTPVSSPMAVSPVQRAPVLESQLPPSAPIRIAINDRNVMRIALPEPRRAVNDRNGDMNLDRSGNGSDVKRMHSGGLPPVAPPFKETNRKASPVSPMDMFKWNGASQS